MIVLICQKSSLFISFDSTNKFHAKPPQGQIYLPFSSKCHNGNAPFPKVKKSRHDKAIHQPILLIILHLELYIRAMQMRFFLVLYFKLLQWFKGPVTSWQGLFMELCGRKGNKMWRLQRKRKRAVKLACLPAQYGLGWSVVLRGVSVVRAGALLSAEETGGVRG